VTELNISHANSKCICFELNNLLKMHGSQTSESVTTGSPDDRGTENDGKEKVNM
jgi:hypothetical protein